MKTSLVLVFSAACGGGTPPLAEPAPVVEPAPAVAPSFAAFDLASARARFDGTWLINAHGVDSDYANAPAIWTFTPTTVAIDRVDKKLDLAITSPCKMELTSTSGPMTQTFTYNFAWDGDVLYAGIRGAGIRKGGDIVVCLWDDSLLVVHDGACAFWTEENKGEWTSKEATCATSTIDGAEYLHAEGEEVLNGLHQPFTSLAIRGDALVEATVDPFTLLPKGGFEQDNVTTKFADVAAAKAAFPAPH